MHYTRPALRGPCSPLPQRSHGMVATPPPRARTRLSADIVPSDTEAARGEGLGWAMATSWIKEWSQVRRAAARPCRFFILKCECLSDRVWYWNRTNPLLLYTPSFILRRLTFTSTATALLTAIFNVYLCLFRCFDCCIATHRILYLQYCTYRDVIVPRPSSQIDPHRSACAIAMVMAR
ncbi:hypothetical protein DENSPDRAFT_50919 [Dentipellis sp. KUC8613]|nr:hypothetical protein DENSPDRAFT_50919 [Dentipellis sp. KUC8613]